MRYNKVRGILRAKNGSQIPKFQVPAGPLELNFGMMNDSNMNYFDQASIYDPMAKYKNPLIQGSTIPKPAGPPATLNQITSNPIGNIQQQNMQASQNWINQNLPDIENGAEWSQQTASQFAQGYDPRPTWAMPEHLQTPVQQQTALQAINGINADGTQNNSFTNFNPSILNSNLYNIPNIKTKTKLKDKLGALGKNKKIQGAVTAGVDAITNKLTGGTKNSQGFDAATNILGMAQKIPGPIGWYTTAANVALKAANKIGAEKINSHTLSTYYKTKMGSYGGMMALNNEVEANKDVEFGLFNRGGFNKAQSQADELGRQIGIATGIIDTAADQFAMRDSNHKYNQYDGQVNGYALDPRTYALVSKQGGTLSTKIELLKSCKFNQVINVDTKQVEEFKEGGVLQSYTSKDYFTWEPVIEPLDWEPIIEIPEFKDGGSIKEELETPEIEETNQKNLIPEGALHKNKHHMEHTEGLTQKGIPVVDNDGEQQAEIELDEIIFTLEVTKKLEELYKDGSDEAAIEAGKLLVKEILFNTDDRTGLIAKCEEGGKL